MNRETRKTLKGMKQKLVDFFFVYYDLKISRHVFNHPEDSVTLIREAIDSGINSRSRLTIYAGALRDAIEYQSLLLAENQKAALAAAKPA